MIFLEGQKDQMSVVVEQMIRSIFIFVSKKVESYLNHIHFSPKEVRSDSIHIHFIIKKVSSDFFVYKKMIVCG